MSKPGSDKRGEQIDRVVELTASRISAALDKMADDLPEDAAPQMALELVVRKLEELQPWIMGLIMDFVIREGYAAAVAEKPSKPKARRAFSFLRKYRRMTNDHGLHVEVQGGEIVVILPGSTYSVAYCKSPKGPHLFATMLPTTYDPDAVLTSAEFLVQALKVANDKARELGWIV